MTTQRVHVPEARYIGANEVETKAGNIIHDALVTGAPSARIVERLAAAGLLVTNPPTHTKETM